MRLLITGATGFVGRHLVELLANSRDFELHGLTRRLHVNDHRIVLHSIDWSDLPSLVELMQRLHPDCVIHLAGNADAGSSFADPAAAWTGNLLPAQNLYHSLVKASLTPRVLHVSSGAVYGRSLAKECVCDETFELLPISPYGASKAAAEMAALQYHDRLPIIRVRPFNHIGPGQSNHFAIANFAEQIARIEAGLADEVLKTGNLDSERDITDVRDMVRAYQRLILTGQPGEVYNAGRGERVKMRQCVESLIGKSRVKIQLQATLDRMRPSDISKMRISNRRLCEKTGWQPAITLDQTLEDVLNDWRGRITN